MVLYVRTIWHYLTVYIRSRNGKNLHSFFSFFYSDKRRKYSITILHVINVFRNCPVFNYFFLLFLSSLTFIDTPSIPLLWDVPYSGVRKIEGTDYFCWFDYFLSSDDYYLLVSRLVTHSFSLSVLSFPKPYINFCLRSTHIFAVLYFCTGKIYSSY